MDTRNPTGATPIFKTHAMNMILFVRELRQAMDDMFRPYGMSSSRWMALAILKDALEPMSQKELALRMDIEGATLVRIIDALERDGWVRRRVSPLDRRIKLVSMEPKAQEFVKIFMFSMRRLDKALYNGIPDSRVLDSIGLLEELRANLQSFTEDMREEATA
ncbi:MarR family transcriptional regulator [Desulfocurvus sp.]|jgi:MarR family transcriptional regulator for hemolysin|uniref:MarR family winged helix-turn-helix transcriptional regulator n=1 Tax=Desulfocurvus sp. TaxID=2871698 RepID=UPI0025BCC34E|nr:MarR family transcriptional regulator [Desulfocurvus sp.]MCK9241100.1 MarR family transcriptional regulator [Desulfocurvus sp.]